MGKRGTYQSRWSQNLNPNPVVSSVQVFLLTSEVPRGHQLVGRGAGRCRLAHRCSVVFTSLLIPSSHSYCIIVMSILQMRKQFGVAGEGKHMGGRGPTHLPFSAHSGSQLARHHSPQREPQHISSAAEDSEFSVLFRDESCGGGKCARAGPAGEPQGAYRDCCCRNLSPDLTWFVAQCYLVP